MDANSRFAQTECLTDFARRLVRNVTHREHGTLSIRKLLDRLGDLPGTLARDHAVLRARLHGGRVGRSGFDGREHRNRPPQSARAGLAQIETPVDEDPSEPHLEGVLFPIACDVREHFYERVLYGLIGVVRIAKVAVGDPDRAALMLRDEIAELLPRALAFTGQDKCLEARRERRVP